jgi:hypothetical protein
MKVARTARGGVQSLQRQCRATNAPIFRVNHYLEAHYCRPSRGAPSGWQRSSLAWRWCHSTPISTTTATTNTNTVSMTTSSSITRTSPWKVQGEPDKSMELLNIAAAEGRRALELAKQQRPSNDNDSYQATVVSKALDAAEELLLATQQTDSLSLIVANHHAHPLEEPPVLLQVTILHRAFLTLTQWCLVLATSTRSPQQHAHAHSKSSSSSSFLLLLDNPLLEVALKLTARAQELSLPFHLPLYQRLVTTLAEHSLDPIPNILKLAHWAGASFDRLPATFFSGALVQLTQRQRLVDVVHLLQAMNTVHHMEYVEEETTREILVLLKPHFNKVWMNSNSAAPHPESSSSPMISTVEQDAVQVVLLLESSIWNLLNYGDDNDDGTGMLEDATLKEAVGAIIRAEEEARQDAAHRQTLQDLLVEDSFSDDDDEDDDHDLDDDELLNFQDYSPNDSQGRAFKDWMQAMANGGGELPRNMHIKIHRSGEETIMQVMGTLPEDEEDDSDEGGHPHEREMASLIYTRAHGYRDFPDVAAQVYEANGGLKLLYSREFERHVVEQLDPGSDDDDDYDDI